MVQSVIVDALSTCVGSWAILKVRFDRDPELASRIKSAQRGTGDPQRTIRAIASKLTSTNTIVASS